VAHKESAAHPDAAQDMHAHAEASHAQTAPALTAPERPVHLVEAHTELQRLVDYIAVGTGPVAVDAERASGFRYGGSAYLVQLGRADIGDVLIDPTRVTDFTDLQAALSGVEWVLHAATQDLPCLSDLGLRPRRLFDTELAGRLAGLPRVGLGPMVETLLGVRLAKTHGAADWSRRPLPESWLDYAALDVEVLVDLRDAVAELLTSQGKFDWAMQEFAALVDWRPQPPRDDPWRRTSGIHRISDRRTLGAIRELWIARDDLARRRDLAPHRVLPDPAIIAAATALPRTQRQLAELGVFSGPMQRRQAGIWLAAIDRARELPTADLPPSRVSSDGPPAPQRWAAKDPEAAARLGVVRTHLAATSERLSIPVENLISPDLVRRVLWRPPDPADLESTLETAGARPWQIELVRPILASAIDGRRA
jgi:ribonuclease D